MVSKKDILNELLGTYVRGNRVTGTVNKNRIHEVSSAFETDEAKLSSQAILITVPKPLRRRLLSKDPMYTLKFSVTNHIEDRSNPKVETKLFFDGAAKDCLDILKKRVESSRNVQCDLLKLLDEEIVINHLKTFSDISKFSYSTPETDFKVLENKKLLNARYANSTGELWFRYTEGPISHSNMRYPLYLSVSAQLDYLGDVKPPLEHQIERLGNLSFDW
jgi:hypothetical protein